MKLQEICNFWASDCCCCYIYIPSFLREVSTKSWFHVKWIGLQWGKGGKKTLFNTSCRWQEWIALFAFYLSSPVLDSKCVGGENLKLPKPSLTQEVHLQQTNHHSSKHSQKPKSWDCHQTFPLALLASLQDSIFCQFLTDRLSRASASV